jgi:hypothetical protein
MFNAWYLVHRGAADLAHAFGDPVDAVQVGLAQLSTVRVDGKPPADLDGAAANELLGLPAGAESKFFQLREHERREMVVKHGGLHVRGPDCSLPVQLFPDQRQLRQTGDIRAVVAGHRILIRAGTLGRARDDGRRMRQRPRPFQRGYDQRLRAVGFLAAVQQAQRLGDPSAALVIFEGNRLAVEPGFRIGRGMAPVGHAHPAEVLAGRSAEVHVAPGEHGDLLRGCQQAERVGEGQLRTLGRRGHRPAARSQTEAQTGAFVEGAVDDNHVADAGVDRQRRLL